MDFCLRPLAHDGLGFRGQRAHGPLCGHCERELPARCLAGLVLDRGKRSLSILCGKLVGVQDCRAEHTAGCRPLDCLGLLEFRVGDTCVSGDCLCDLCKDGFRVLKREVLLVAHGLCDLADDLPVGLRAADRFDGLADPLDAALGVGDRAVALCKGCRGQDDVCLCGSLGHEEVLDDEEVKLGERIGDVGACGGDVLADHVECLDLAGCRRFDHGRDREAPFSGDCADIGRSLGVTLAAEEVDTCAGLADITGDHLEVCKGPDQVAGAGACGGDDRCGLGCGKDLGSFRDISGTDAGCLCDRFRSARRSCGLCLLEVFCMLCDVVLILFSGLDNRGNDAVDERDTGARVAGNVEVCKACSCRGSGVSDDDLCTVQLCKNDPAACKRVLLKRVASDNEDCLCFA